MESSNSQPPNSPGQLAKPTGNDDMLWQIARKRASFKLSVVSYLFVNAMLIAIWFFTAGQHSYFWPMWPMLGWGIGLAFQYLHAYHTSKFFSIEEEYQKLKQQQ